MKAVFLDFATMGPDLDVSPLTKLLPELEFFDVTPNQMTMERVRDADIVFTNKIRFDDDTLRNAKSLRFIGLTATGTDNIDLSGAERYGIAVCNIRAYCTQSVVEHVFGTLLYFTHSLSLYAEAVRQGAWQTSDDFCMLDFPIRELSGMTMGIVGLGELGRAVAQTARQFGMSVIVAGRSGAGVDSGDGRVNLRAMLKLADVVSLHCPLNEQTRKMFGEQEFRQMKNDAILINTARGGLIDSAALASALRDGEIGAAAVDVLPREPPRGGDPLLEYGGTNLLITPHIAWATAEARQNAINELAANVEAFLKGERRNRIV